MKSFLAFMNKEWMEYIRNGKILILFFLVIVYGVTSPTFAKLTPAMMEMMSDSLAQSGMIVTEVEVSALDSWNQFYKNYLMFLIPFIVLCSASFTKEYDKGTLILSLTKGMKRYKVVLAKLLVICILWTISYGCSVAITYGYTAYFWNQSIVENLSSSLFCCWSFGIFIISIMVLCSVIGKSNAFVLIGTGLVGLICNIVGMFADVETYTPSYLITPYLEWDASFLTIGITASICILCWILSIYI